jgi:hypothetical protein
MAFFGCKSTRSLDAKANLAYEISADRPILNKDIKIRSFYKAIESYPPLQQKVPDEIERIANREIHRIKTEKAISDLQRKINSELIYFHLLDLYLLPVYFKTGEPKVEEEILNCLVQLYDIQSKAELYLQARALHAISQGGYKYPELEKYLATAIGQELNKNDSKELEKAKELLLTLNSNS